ncbi:MAG TPA: YaiI/YqxD family protein, partial [Firmicutes bacterium]|nr:YaiI/YqxD family protein [Bacillota bacterium]
MKIIIDGDSAPLKEDITALAEENGIKAVIVTSIAHYTEKTGVQKAETVLVDNRSQAADIKIMNLADRGDVCITGDSGLAHVLFGKGV